MMMDSMVKDRNMQIVIPTATDDGQKHKQTEFDKNHI